MASARFVKRIPVRGRQKLHSFAVRPRTEFAKQVRLRRRARLQVDCTML